MLLLQIPLGARVAKEAVEPIESAAHIGGKVHTFAYKPKRDAEKEARERERQEVWAKNGSSEKAVSLLHVCCRCERMLCPIYKCRCCIRSLTELSLTRVVVLRALPDHFTATQGAPQGEKRSAARHQGARPQGARACLLAWQARHSHEIVARAALLAWRRLCFQVLDVYLRDTY